MDSRTDNPRALLAWRRTWTSWIDNQRKSGTPGTIILGRMSRGTVETLESRNIVPASRDIYISKTVIDHILRDAKKARGAALTEIDIRQLPDILANPRAVLLDTRDKDHTLLYVFDPSDPQKGREAGKVVVRVNYEGKTRQPGRSKKGVTANFIRTAGYVSMENLKGVRYQLLEGNLE